jgi:hypothetical protein
MPIPLRPRTGGRRQCVSAKMLSIVWVVHVLLIMGIEISVIYFHMEGGKFYYLCVRRNCVVRDT